MSSRNARLDERSRAQATALWRALRLARAAVRGTKAPVPARRLRAEVKKFIEQQPAARLDYVEFFDPDTLQPVTRVRRGAQMALAARGGERAVD